MYVMYIYSGIPSCIDTEDLHVPTRPSMITTSVQSVTQASHLISGASSVHYVFFLKWYWIFYSYLQFIGSWQMLYVLMHFQYHCVSMAAYYQCIFTMSPQNPRWIKIQYHQHKASKRLLIITLSSPNFCFVNRALHFRRYSDLRE